MGFWQTGYWEFHEPTGIHPPVVVEPPRFFCDDCGKSFPSRDELADHRFEDHPLLTPVLVVQGREIGKNRVQVSRTLRPSDVRTGNCDSARLNDHDIPVPDLPTRLAALSRDSNVCRIVLENDGVEKTFELEFRIASMDDLENVETRFRDIARGGRLDMKTIDDFIEPKSQFGTAIGYCDGICAYLYGILAKEGRSGSRLNYGGYVQKFNRAAETLKAYDRPLARTIGSLIEFHFNHFGESGNLAPRTRVGMAARRYCNWIHSDRTAPHREAEHLPADSAAFTDDLDRQLTDETTERIIRWLLRPMRELFGQVKDIELLLKNGLAEYDKAKLHVLLGNLHALLGNGQSARSHANAIQNLLGFGTWATTLIECLPGEGR